MVYRTFKTIGIMVSQESGYTIKPSSLAMSLHVVEMSQSGGWMYSKVEAGIIECTLSIFKCGDHHPQQ